MCGSKAAHLQVTQSKTEDLAELRQILKEEFQSAAADGRLGKAFATMRKEKEAKELEEMRQSMGHALQSAMADGRLTALLADLKGKKSLGDSCLPMNTWDACQESFQAQKEVLNVRHNLRKTLTDALFDGRLSEAISTVQQEKQAKEMEHLRNRLRRTFVTAIEDDRLEAAFEATEITSKTRCVPEALEASESVGESVESTCDVNLRLRAKMTLKEAVSDGRLVEAVAALKKEREDQKREELRQNLHQTFKCAMDNGNLDAIIANLKKKKEAEELETMRQSVQQTLQASLLDGRLSEVVRSLKVEKEAKEVEMTKQEVKSTLQASLLDGRLSEVIAQIKKEKLAKQVETTKQEVKSTLQASLLDGRLSEVIAQIKKEKLAKQSGEQLAPSDVAKTCEEVTECPKPVRPVSAKTATRPARRSGLRTAGGQDKEQAAPDAGRTVEAAGRQSPVTEIPLLPPRLPTPIASLKMAPPASPKVGSLPPVIPPCKRAATPPSSLGRRSSSLNSRSSPSAMSLDLGESCSMPSATSLPRSSSGLRSSSQKARSPPSAMSLDLGDSRSMVDFDKNQKASQLWFLDSLRVTKTSPKQTSGFLPPISGGMDKGSAQRRGSSMDSFVWGVAPVVNTRVEWGASSNQLVF